MKLKIAFIDILGLVYDGNTLKHRGLGGSESAVILMSRELTRLGFDVTVFNNCKDKTSSDGIYDGVRYIDLSDLKNNNESFDIVISSRNVIPFVPQHEVEYAQHLLNIFGINAGDKIKAEDFHHIVQNSKYRAVWMHDTFCSGDESLERLVVSGYINEIFVLSDWHSTYVMNCEHGDKRNFEVLKRNAFMTRNGITKYHDEVDITKKDPNLYVYNASVTKGMLPLIEDIWPRVKERLPDAKLKVIGGFYKFSDNSPGDEQEKKFWQLYHDNEKKNLDVEFTGIVKQSEIADILSEASYMIYPSAFPETFGISTLESLYYCTPLITTRFGALEETAIEDVSYMIDYPIEPNGLFPNISFENQVNCFVDRVVEVYNDPYLHQQKQHACRKIKDICGWDTVALQWKQHFYRLFDIHMSSHEYRDVMKINSKIHNIFGRRMMNKEEFTFPRTNSERRIVVITPFYNAENYISKCIESVAAQDYDNYIHVLINDLSTDDTYDIARKKIDSLPSELQDRFIMIHNTENRGAVRNQIESIRIYAGDDDIVILLDGDDWLAYRNDIFTYINTLHHDGADFTYGSCWSLADNIPLISQEYPKAIRENKTFRDHKFNWGMPYTHLRTFRGSLLKYESNDPFTDETGQWYKAGGDNSVFYTAIENASNVVCVQEILYIYNDLNPLNDYKVNDEEQTRTAQQIVKKTKEEKSVMNKKILIAVPTNRNIEVETFKSIYDLEIPEGYETEFQYFFGYQIDQIRNLMAEWGKHYDYLFNVDSDIVLPKDTLTKMLQANKDIISGLYIQRVPDTHTLEIYMTTPNGGLDNVPLEEIEHQRIIEIGACGFGCVLIKGDVLRKMEYPHFHYQSSLNFQDTVSEDVYFCMKAKECGFSIWADTTIRCEHIGQTKYLVREIGDPVLQRLRNLSNQDLLPIDHENFLHSIKDLNPKTVYDIGACVLHWTRHAKEVWPDSKYVLFEAMDEVEPIFRENGYNDYHLGVLSSQDNQEIEFYQNLEHPGGNSYYRENEKINPMAAELFSEEKMVKKITKTLDTVIREKNLPIPNLIKMDVQGAEMDILKGATETLSNPECRAVILELQHKDYNIGAPKYEQVIEYMESIGFRNEPKGPFCGSVENFDADYFFVKQW